MVAFAAGQHEIAAALAAIGSAVKVLQRGRVIPYMVLGGEAQRHSPSTIEAPTVPLAEELPS